MPSYGEIAQKINKTKKKTTKNRICFVLPGWLVPVKDDLQKMFFKHVSSLLSIKKFNSMFKDYNICIIFKNDASIKNLIVKTKL